MGSRITAPRVVEMKAKGEKIVCITAYDFPGARYADEAGVDVILVGDSMGNVVQGRSSTLPVEMDHILYHTKWVSAAAQRALVVADLPFGSYQSSVRDAVLNSVLLMKAGAAAVKLEGAYTDEIAAIARAGIPVMGHIGFTPQSVHAFGGHKVQGRGAAAERVMNEAIAIEKAGAFAIVLELMPAALSAEITAKLSIPTIGIGAGHDCNGQIQVYHDILGLTDLHLKHAKRYAELGEATRSALSEYCAEVREKRFPTKDQEF